MACPSFVVISSPMKKVIMFAGKNPDIARDVEKCLGVKEFDFLFAADSTAGINMALQAHPAVIILDEIVKGADPNSFTEKLKAHVELEHIPILLLTSPKSSFLQPKELIAGIDDYIEKPIRSNVIQDKVHTLLQKAALFQSIDKEKAQKLKPNPLELETRQNNDEKVVIDPISRMPMFNPFEADGNRPTIIGESEPEDIVIHERTMNLDDSPRPKESHGVSSQIRDRARLEAEVPDKSLAEPAARPSQEELYGALMSLIKFHPELIEESITRLIRTNLTIMVRNKFFKDMVAQMVREELQNHLPGIIHEFVGRLQDADLEPAAAVPPEDEDPGLSPEDRMVDEIRRLVPSIAEDLKRTFTDKKK